MKNRLKITLCIAVGCCAFFLRADEPVWKHEVSGGFTLTDGNSDTTLLDLGGKSQAEFEKGAFLAKANYRYGANNQETSTDKSTVDLETNRNLTERSYALVNGSYLRDTQADIDNRLLIGPGLGLKVLDDEVNILRLEGATVWRYEELASVESDSIAFRVGEKYERTFPGGATIWQSAEVVALADDFQDYDLEFVLGAEAPLVKAVFLRVELSDRYDSTPAEGKEENDLTLVTGFSYKF